MDLSDRARQREASVPQPKRIHISTIVLAFVLPISAVANELTLKNLISQTRESVVTIQVSGRDGAQYGIGTGFIVDESGLIATNFHVINEGREFTVETAAGKKLEIVSVEASDRSHDLALVRVNPSGIRLPALTLSDEPAEQGTRVAAFGNPHGLRDSVVEGIVSAIRDVDGQEMIQLAMPIEPGNSGGPLVDRQGRVLGIVNMKSAVDENLGFAIPIGQLILLRDKPNPVAIHRWTRLGQVNESRWTPLLGGQWQQRGGMISASGLGDGFGGRSLCLSTDDVPQLPFECSVMVRLDDESGAAGLAFHSDGADRHYGFYPSNGQLRLTCFKGPSVYSWEVLREFKSEHYLPDQWNQLRVRIEEDRFQCFVNGHMVVESTDRQLTDGKVGLCKFRDTKPDFRVFRMANELPTESIAPDAQEWFKSLDQMDVDLSDVHTADVDKLAASEDTSARELTRRAKALQQQAEKLLLLAGDTRQQSTLAALGELMMGDESNESLLRGALLIAKLDDPDLEIEAYEQQVDQMVDELKKACENQPDALARRKVLDHYLFVENGFHGGRAQYYHRANSHLSRVIDDREGLPITLSILYIELGRRLGLRIEGVGLPGHFVVKQAIDDQTQLIDVFDGGEDLSRETAEQIVRQNLQRDLTEEDLRPQTQKEILTRVMNNLMGAATRRREAESMLRYMEAIVAINPESAGYRLMRAQLRGMTDRDGRAIEDLDWLLEHNPPDIDPHQVQQMRQVLIDRSR